MTASTQVFSFVCINGHLHSWLDLKLGSVQTLPMPGAERMQNLCKYTPTAMKQVATLVRRAQEYLCQRHLFLLLSCVRIHGRDEKKKEKINLQLNCITGDYFLKNMNTMIKHVRKMVVRLYTGSSSSKSELLTTCLCIMCMMQKMFLLLICKLF